MGSKSPSLINFSEDEFGKKIDRCLTDTLIKAGNINQYNTIDKTNFLHDCIT